MLLAHASCENDSSTCTYRAKIGMRERKSLERSQRSTREYKRGCTGSDTCANTDWWGQSPIAWVRYQTAWRGDMRWGRCAAEISIRLQQQSELWRHSGEPSSEARAKKHTRWGNFCLSSPAAKEHWQLRKQQPSCASTSHLNAIKSNYSTQTFCSYWITCWGTWKWTRTDPPWGVAVEKTVPRYLTAQIWTTMVGWNVRCWMVPPADTAAV